MSDNGFDPNQPRGDGGKWTEYKATLAPGALTIPAEPDDASPELAENRSEAHQRRTPEQIAEQEIPDDAIRLARTERDRKILMDTRYIIVRCILADRAQTAAPEASPRMNEGIAGLDGPTTPGSSSIPDEPVGDRPPAQSHRRPAHDYWSTVAALNGLTSEEEDTVRAYAQTIEMDTTTTTHGVIAGALEPGVTEALETSRAADDAASDLIGGRIGHGTFADGTPTVTLHDSTQNYMISCFTDGERTSFRVGGVPYLSLGEIPRKFRKARTIASDFEANKDALAEAIKVHEDYQRVYDRWRPFAASR